MVAERSEFRIVYVTEPTLVTMPGKPKNEYRVFHVSKDNPIIYKDGIPLGVLIRFKGGGNGKS